jgi:hypothetical protein
MSNLEVQIKPSGISKRNLVDCFYAVVSSIQGICKKLDADDVTDTDYESLCFTAIFNGAIENSRGDRVANALSGKEDTFFVMSPTGINNRSIINCIYQIFLMMETLTEKIDADAAPPSSVTYEALVYTAHYLWTVKDEYGNSVGASTTQTITPMGIDELQLVDILYCFVHSLDTLTKKLDTDAVPSGSDYEALWDTANILMQVEDSKGNVAGNALTQFNP